MKRVNWLRARSDLCMLVVMVICGSESQLGSSRGVECEKGERNVFSDPTTRYRTRHNPCPLLNPSNDVHAATRHPCSSRRRDCLRGVVVMVLMIIVVFVVCALGKNVTRVYFYHGCGKNCLDTQEPRGCPSSRREIPVIRS